MLKLADTSLSMRRPPSTQWIAEGGKKMAVIEDCEISLSDNDLALTRSGHA